MFCSLQCRCISFYLYSCIHYITRSPHFHILSILMINGNSMIRLILFTLSTASNIRENVFFLLVFKFLRLYICFCSFFPRKTMSIVSIKHAHLQSNSCFCPTSIRTRIAGMVSKDIFSTNW